MVLVATRVLGKDEFRVRLSVWASAVRSGDHASLVRRPDEFESRVRLECIARQNGSRPLAAPPAAGKRVTGCEFARSGESPATPCV